MAERDEEPTPQERAARRRALLAALDAAMTTSRSRDDSDVGWSQASSGDADAQLRRDRPPHWRN